MARSSAPNRMHAAAPMAVPSSSKQAVSQHRPMNQHNLILLWWTFASMMVLPCGVGGHAREEDVQQQAILVPGSSQFAGFHFDLPIAPHTMAQSQTPSTPPVPSGHIAIEGYPEGGVLPAGGAWVNVTTECTGGTSTGWWVGLFPASSPMIKAVNPGDPSLGNNTGSPFTPPFVKPAPLKYTYASCNTTRAWWAPDVRQAMVFVLLSGGTSSSAIMERSRTPPLTHASAGHPMHVRLARTDSPTTMRVSWTSAHNDTSTVAWGTVPTALTTVEHAVSSTYTPEDVCGEPARTLGWFDPGVFHTALLDVSRLSPGTSVYYQVASGQWKSTVHVFKTPTVGPTSTVRAVLTADMGATTLDGTSQHWAEAQAKITTAGMNAWSTKMSADLAFNVGDLSYATGYLGKWETFMSAIEPLSSSIPYMAALGNHEQDWPGTGVVGAGAENGRDSGGECGVPTAYRFPMAPTASYTPNDSNNNRHETTRMQRRDMHSIVPSFPLPYWYSFDAGPVHFAMVNTEVGSLWNGTQMDWLAADLHSVNRSHTPWVVVMGHRNEFDGRRDVFEELMYNAQVDVTVAGHVHYARRSCPLYMGICRTPNITGGYDGIVHVVAGNGGQALNNASAPNALHPYTGSGCNWTDPNQNCTAAKKITGPTQGSGTEFGFSYFEANATTFVWSFIGNNDTEAHYTFALHRAYPRPDPPSSRHV
eukprot:m.191993 g.191993  ORF g.191993 m.191993 type:complete len:702 (-) comp18535_c0_seq1:91-2196(-)